MALAGELSPTLSRSHARTRSSARHSRLGRAPSSRLLRSPQLLHRLQAPGFRLPRSSLASPDSPNPVRHSTDSALSAPFYRARETRFGLRSPTPRCLRPFSDSRPILGESGRARRQRSWQADVDEITDPARRGNPCICWAAPPFDADSPWLAQRWRRFGDEGESMLFVLFYWVRCGLCDGEELSLL